MSKQLGAFGYDSPTDMVGKLGRDLQRMRVDPHDKDAAIDFFKTANDLVDWLKPDKKKTGDRSPQRSRLVTSNPDLELTWRIATGSKHLVVLSHTDGNVGFKEEFGGFSPAAFSSNAFSPNAFKFDGLQIQKPDGDYEPALALAERVINYWTTKTSSTI